MKILLVTNASKTTGLGHLIRCLQISSLLDEHNIENNIFLDIDQELDIRYLIKNKKIIFGNYIELKNLNFKNYDLLIFDSYQNREILNNIDIKKYLISDSPEDINYEINGIIDFNFENKLVYKNTNLDNLLGPEFFPISKKTTPEFIFKINYSEHIKNVLISVGGVSDNKLFELDSLINDFSKFENINLYIADPQNKLSQYSNKCTTIPQMSLSAILKKYSIDLALNNGGLSKHILYRNKIHCLFIERTSWEKQSIDSFIREVGGFKYVKGKDLRDYDFSNNLFEEIPLNNHNFIKYLTK